MTLKQYGKEVEKVFKAYEKIGTKPWTWEIASRDLPVQVGQLLHAIAKLKGERYAKGSSKRDLTTMIEDELADIFAEVVFIAYKLDINLEKAFSEMKTKDLQKIAQRKK